MAPTGTHGHTMVHVVTLWHRFHTVAHPHGLNLVHNLHTMKTNLWDIYVETYSITEYDPQFADVNLSKKSINEIGINKIFFLSQSKEEKKLT